MCVREHESARRVQVEDLDEVEEGGVLHEGVGAEVLEGGEEVGAVQAQRDQKEVHLH